MAAPHQTHVSSWSVRLAAELTANDQAASKLVADLTDEQLNWSPAPGSWSMGQCLEHLCVTNEAYLPPISAALKNKPQHPVDQIIPGSFGSWFIRSFVEPLPGTKRAPAPRKIRPGPRTNLSVLHRFLSGNQTYRDLILHACGNNVNRIRFWNPFLPGLRFTVGTGLEIIASHERRHLLQANRVKDSPNFPR